MRLRLWVSLWGLLWGAGCAAGSMPQAVSQRPLTVPAGEHQIEFDLGARRRVREGSLDSAQPLISASYRYGITDRIEVTVPPGVSYRLGDRGLQLRLRGGLVGFGASYLPLVAPQDPRQRAAFREAATFVSEVEALSRLRWGPTRAMDVSMAALFTATVGAKTLAGWAARLAWLEDFGDWVSLAMSAHLSRREVLDDRPVLTTGVAFTTRAHVTPWVDVVALVGYDAEPLRKGQWVVIDGLASDRSLAHNYLKITGGLDVRFD